MSLRQVPHRKANALQRPIPRTLDAGYTVVRWHGPPDFDYGWRWPYSWMRTNT
ncbi:MAG: hypothetical protein WBM71_04660 [Sedimenticolaceae bacterium]